MPPSLTTLQCLLPGGCQPFPGGPSGPAGFLQRISTLIGSLFPSFLDFSWRYMPDPSLTCPCSALRSGVASRRLLPTQNSGEPELLTDPLTDPFVITLAVLNCHD